MGDQFLFTQTLIKGILCVFIIFYLSCMCDLLMANHFVVVSIVTFMKINKAIRSNSVSNYKLSEAYVSIDSEI